MNELQDVPLWLWLLIAALLMVQGTMLFRDARRRGRKAWFWGLWAITTVPLPSLLYLLVVILPERRRRKRQL